MGKYLLINFKESESFLLEVKNANAIKNDLQLGRDRSKIVASIIGLLASISFVCSTVLYLKREDLDIAFKVSLPIGALLAICSFTLFISSSLYSTREENLLTFIKENITLENLQKDQEPSL